MIDGGKPGNGGDPDERGFMFPGDFEITAVGDAAADLKARVPQLLADEGFEVVEEIVRHRHSREGNYIAVTVRFHCPSRQRYEAAHAALRADPAIRQTL